MKKSLLILPLIAGLALPGCDLFKKKTNDEDSAWIFEPVIEGGTDGEKNAILRAVNDLSVCVRKGGTDLFPTSKNVVFSGDEQDYLRVLNHVKVDDYTVDLTWDFKTSQAAYDTKLSVDENADIVYLKYPAAGGAETTYEWDLTKIVCGKAVSTDTKGHYSAKLKAPLYDWQAMSIADINAVTDDGADHAYTVSSKTYHYESISNIIKYDATNTKGYSPWWNTGRASDAESNYIFAEVKGKVIFLSPDGNWGLLANGDHIMEIYSGSELDLNTTSYPELANGYVSIKGEVSHYYGNFQLSFIKSIRKINASEVTEPTMSYAQINYAKLSAAKLARDQASAAVTKNRIYKQFTSQFEQNSLGEVTGKVLTAPSSTTKGARFTFDIEVAGEGENKIKMEVAYDYHTDKGVGDVEAALRAKAVVGNTITVRGTMRFSHGSDKTLVPFSIASGATEGYGTGGNWSIVPFLASHMVA